MFKKITQDLQVQSNYGTYKLKLKIFFLNHSFHLLVLFRFGHYIRNIPFIGAFLRIVIEYIIRVIYSSDISCKAVIGSGANIMHGHDIVIGSEVKVGNNFKIFNGVTLGNKDTETIKICQPNIGNNVIIGTGAKILGGVSIGDYSIIGANSVVVKDIPEYEIWGGVPAKKIRDNNE